MSAHLWVAEVASAHCCTRRAGGDAGAAQEANAGLAMHGMTVVDRALVVELVAAARDAAAAGPVNPYAALQMQQMHQVRPGVLSPPAVLAQGGLSLLRGRLP